ncbi:MAG: DUF1684 domain-containing protein [Acidobacteria bacterium]|nr:DUF1684 domain-containing protein [Acidobacteriota bacterium]
MSLRAIRLLPVTILVLFVSCEPRERSPLSDKTTNQAAPGYGDELLRERREKDMAFRSGSGSPLSGKDRRGFRGLDYYPVDPALRFRVRLHRHSIARRVRMATNTGEMRTGLRYGYFEFEIEGTTCRLHAYRMEGDDDRSGPTLFVPFRDATSGNETYAAGRYLEVPENTTGVYDLDFNRAYNPYCAYRDDYSCPVPPEENVLKVAIRAGEKDYRRF